MKKIKFTCTSCQARLRVPTHLAGVSAPCPKCGATITAPTDISGAVEDDTPSRRNVSPESFRGRQASSASPQRVRHIPEPVAAAGVAVAGLKSETSGTHVAQSRFGDSKSSAVLKREGSASAVELAQAIPVAEPTALPEPELPILDSQHPYSASDPEDPYVVVEVLNVPLEQPPPLTPITQPIQVNPRLSILPEVRSDATVSSPPLPRLDFSLAAQEGSSVSPIFFSEEGSQPGRLVVKLPQPGSEPHQFNPDDFIFPAVSREPEEPRQEYLLEELGPVDSGAEPLLFDDDLVDMADDLEPIPLEEVELQDFEETLSAIPGPGPGRNEEQARHSVGGTIASEPETERHPTKEAESFVWAETGLPPVQGPPSAERLPWNTQQTNGAADDTVHRTLSTDWQSMDTQPIPTLGALNVDPSDEAPVMNQAEFEGNSLHEGSVGKLFARQSFSADPSAEARSPGFPRETAVPSDLKDEGHVLDELFGSPPGESRGMSKTAVLMLCGIGGAAIIATVVVIFLINLMGGLDPQLAYAEVDEASAESSSSNTVATPVVLEEPSIDGAPPVIDPVAMLRDESAGGPSAGGPVDDLSSEAVSPVDRDVKVTNPKPAASAETPALSLDERVERIVNGTDPLSTEGPVVPTEAPVVEARIADPVDSAISSFKGATQGTAPGSSPSDSSQPSEAAATRTATVENYNPPPTFPAPGESDSPLRNTNDLIDAFLRAPDWESRLTYTYQGESLRPAISDYYGKWADKKIDRFSLQLFQMEKSTALGGPYWVYLVSTSDQDQGFPLIVRVEDGNLKVDWEIYSEFFDRHFVRFRDGKMPRPSTFRVVVERVSDYYGSDREGFTDLSSYNVYQINPPYGDLNEFSEYAFVKKDSELAKQLDTVVGLNDEPLAVIITLDEKPFAHGVKHYLITEYVTEGWFR